MNDKTTIKAIVKECPQLGFKTFSYKAKKSDNLSVGSVVQVPFGKKISLAIVSSIEPSVGKKLPYKLLDIEKRLDLPPLPKELIGLIEWLCGYYVASTKSVLQAILPSGLMVKNIRRTVITQAAKVANPKKIVLNPEQRRAIKTIKSSDEKSFLIHGVTGSGKTEVYIELIGDQLKKRKSAIVLVPEISLTPQTVERFQAYFPDKIIVTHSKLSSATRRNIWLKVLKGKDPMVIIGPRSALFLPVHNLGLIVVDEEHETSYKQDSPPKYHTSSVAAKLAKLTSSKLVLGSATPSVNTYFLAEKGKIKLIELKNRAKGQKLPDVEVVDLSREAGLISNSLMQKMKDTLKKNRQIILFLNRRGSANAQICTNCGQAVKCPNCDNALTYHADKNKLVCHYCSFTRPPIVQCEKCKSFDVIFIGSGTKKIEQQIQEIFKKARIARIDKDNSDFEHLSNVYQKLRSNEIDILIGTQMITRGLDIEGVDLVGVLLADNMLAIPDFASSEKTFDLLTQVAGRAGRGIKKARAIIQTYNPESLPIASAKNHDYHSFYQSEIKNRKKYLYPPYSYLIKLIYANKSEDSALYKSKLFANKLKRDNKNIVVLGPAECMIKKRANKYRYQIIAKAFNRDDLARIAVDLPAGWSADLDPINLL